MQHDSTTAGAAIVTHIYGDGPRTPARTALLRERPRRGVGRGKSCAPAAISGEFALRTVAEVSTHRPTLSEPRLGLPFLAPGMNETLPALATVSARQAADFRSSPSSGNRRPCNPAQP